MKKFLRRAGLAILILLGLIQLWPAGRANPLVTGDIQAPPEVDRILRRSCYDCHSNETRWPWYAYVAPISWTVVHDVNEGRAEMNFSTWGDLPAENRVKRAEKSIEEVEEKKMPLPSYLRTHGGAAVSAEELEVLRAWAKGLSVAPRD